MVLVVALIVVEVVVVGPMLASFGPMLSPSWDGTMLAQLGGYVGPMLELCWGYCAPLMLTYSKDAILSIPDSLSKGKTHKNRVFLTSPSSDSWRQKGPKPCKTECF